METIHEGARDIPVFAKVDVVVAGGGPAGLGAAIAAARNGASTLLVERLSFLGGVATAALMPQLNTTINAISGVSHELFSRLVEEGGAVSGVMVNFDPEMFKEVALDMCAQAGVQLLFYSWVVAPVVEGERIRGVIVENKSGRKAILANAVIDCTGDADIAAAMGVPCVKGRESDGRMRPLTPLFRMGNVDLLQVVQYCRQHPSEFGPDPTAHVIDVDRGLVRIFGFYDTVRRAREAGELDKDCHYLRMEGGSIEKRTVFINTIRVYNTDATDAAQLSAAEIEARRQMRQLVAFLQKYIPGCERAFLIDSAVSIGVRETRRVIGDYILTEEDCQTQRHFPDAIARLHRRHLPGHEIHSPDADEGSEKDPTRYDRRQEFCFEIPYRSLLPQKSDGLLVAGRCISGTHNADAFFRGVYSCIHMGQAAGTAAAMAAQGGVTPRQVDIGQLREKLTEQGVNLGGREVEAATPTR